MSRNRAGDCGVDAFLVGRGLRTDVASTAKTSQAARWRCRRSRATPAARSAPDQGATLGLSDRTPVRAPNRRETSTAAFTKSLRSTTAANRHPSGLANCRLRIPIKHSGNVTVLKGPPGYYCSAWPDANGRAYAGGCQSKGGGDCLTPKSPYGEKYTSGRGCKVAGGKKAFGWNWNVANRRVVFAHDDKGVLHLVHVSGSDTNVIFRYLKGRYQLQVLNTSGIGYLNGFTWKPSPGWTVTQIKSSTGATCTRTPAGTITCTGTVNPPSCLCTGDGGIVSVEFTATPTKKNAYYLFRRAAQFKVTKMTPVTYLIPRHRTKLPSAPVQARPRGAVAVGLIYCGGSSNALTAVST